MLLWNNIYKNLIKKHLKVYASRIKHILRFRNSFYKLLCSLADVSMLNEMLTLLSAIIITRKKILFQDLQTLMDNATNGVIYFSMGSTWRSKDLPSSVKKGLVKMFGKLKQTVIWKYEEDLPNLPKNLKIVHWAPQQSLLGP